MGVYVTDVPVTKVRSMISAVAKDIQRHPSHGDASASSYRLASRKVRKRLHVLRDFGYLDEPI